MRLPAAWMAGLACALAAGPARGEDAGDAAWSVDACVEAVASSHAPGRIAFRIEDALHPESCSADRALGIGGSGPSKRERYAFGMRGLRDLGLAMLRGSPVRIEGAGCRALRLEPVASGAGVCPAPGGAVTPIEPGAPVDAGAPIDTWQCRTRVAEILSYERGRTLRFRLAAQPDACVTQRFLDWRGAPESTGLRPSRDPDARRANARATLWLLALAKLDGRPVVVSGRGCEAMAFELHDQAPSPSDPGRCRARAFGPSGR